MNWIPRVDELGARYELQHGELDERGLVRKGNVAYAAGLASLMAGVDGAPWFRRAATCWRESWDEGTSIDAWGRPIGALKATLLAGDDAAAGEVAHWTLELGTSTAESPIGRYAAALAFLVLARYPEARHVSESLRGRDDFPPDVAEALATIAAHDVIDYVEAVESIVASFETRDDHLEGVAVADTALVLDALARRRGIAQPLPESPVLPG